MQSRLNKRLKVMISFELLKKNGGPYNSHQKIVDHLKNEIDFIPLVVDTPKYGLINIKLFNSLRKQIKQANPDLVHIHGLQLIGFHLMIAAKSQKKPVLLVVRGSSSEMIEFNWLKKNIVAICEKVTLKYVDQVYAVSEYVASWNQIIKSRGNVPIIYNFAHINVSKNLNFRKKNQLDDDLLFVSCGRITKEKGYEQLCQTIIKYKSNQSQKFIIIGDGEYLDEFKQKIEENNLTSSVLFLGYQESVGSILQECDIFIHLSLHETLSNAVLEACSLGLPVIASNVGGIPEIILNNYNGLLVNPLDIDEVVEAMNRLSNNHDLIKTLRINNQKLLASKFNSNNIKTQILEMYSQTYDC